MFWRVIAFWSMTCGSNSLFDQAAALGRQLGIKHNDCISTDPVGQLYTICNFDSQASKQQCGVAMFMCFFTESSRRVQPRPLEWCWMVLNTHEGWWCKTGAGCYCMQSGAHILEASRSVASEGLSVFYTRLGSNRGNPQSTICLLYTSPSPRD